MINTLARANYIIALLENKMTNEIRDNYYAQLETNTDVYLQNFATILDAMLKAVKKNTFDIDEAISIIETEYNAKDMQQFLGNFNNYINFITFLLSFHQKSDAPIKIHQDFLKTFAEIPNNIIIEGLLYGMLDILVSSSLISYELEFAKNITERLNNINITNIHLLYAHLYTNALSYM